MPDDAFLESGLRVIVLGCFVYLVLSYSVFFILAIFAAFESRLRREQSRAEDFDTLALSRFTIPVSVLVPAYNEEVMICASVESLLKMEYPEYEVVVVNDGSVDGTLGRLVDHFDLEPQQVLYRHRLATEAVRAIYRSAREPRLIVVDKENGAKSDALNCAINFARYRYLCCVDADSFYDTTALLHTMRLALKDPARIVGVTSLISISSQPERWSADDVGKQRWDDNVLVNFQHLDYMRAFLNNRVAWSRFHFMLCSVGAFALWRRDVLVELGGFSRDFTCEDIEMTFRVHHQYLRDKRPYEILCMPESIAVTEGPDRVRHLVSQRARWQRVITETLWSYRGMILNPRYKAVGLLGMPMYLLYEGLVPVVELVAFLSLPLAWWLGAIEWSTFFFVAGCITLANGVLTNWALWSEDRGARRYSIQSLIGFMGLGLVEYVLYRPIILVSRWRGIIDFVRGEKSWQKFARNQRSA